MRLTRSIQMVPKTKTTQILYRFEYTEHVTWVFGTIFVVCVAFLLFCVQRNSLEIRGFLQEFSRKRRIVIGILLFLVAAILGFSALLVFAQQNKSTGDSLIHNILLTICMLGFVVLETSGAVCLISAVVDPIEKSKSDAAETTNEDMRP